jgi:hypothetical protein
MKVPLALNQGSRDFHFGIPNRSSIHPTGLFATAILHFGRQRGFWPPRLHLRDGVNRHLGSLPRRFLGHLVMPRLLSQIFFYRLRILSHRQGQQINAPDRGSKESTRQMTLR